MSIPAYMSTCQMVNINGALYPGLCYIICYTIIAKDMASQSAAHRCAKNCLKRRASARRGGGGYHRAFLSGRLPSILSPMKRDRAAAYSAALAVIGPHGTVAKNGSIYPAKFGERYVKPLLARRRRISFSRRPAAFAAKANATGNRSLGAVINLCREVAALALYSWRA